MSVIQQSRKNRLELKLRFANMLHSFDIFYSQVFPANTPGFFNNAIGLEPARSWLKKREKISEIYSWVYIVIFMPLGAWGVADNSSNLIAWFFIVAGIISSFLIMLNRMDKRENTDKNYHDLKILHIKLEKKYDELKKQLDEI